MCGILSSCLYMRPARSLGSRLGSPAGCGSRCCRGGPVTCAVLPARHDALALADARFLKLVRYIRRRKVKRPRVSTRTSTGGGAGTAVSVRARARVRACVFVSVCERHVYTIFSKICLLETKKRIETPRSLMLSRCL